MIYRADIGLPQRLALTAAMAAQVAMSGMAAAPLTPQRRPASVVPTTTARVVNGTVTAVMTSDGQQAAESEIIVVLDGTSPRAPTDVELGFLAALPAAVTAVAGVWHQVG